MKTTKVLKAISALNLEPIKTKLMDADSGEGWSAAQAAATEVEYRRFLHLMYNFPDAEVSPSKAVDTFWHYHILDTQKYAADCEQVFGCFMHHNPYGEDGAGAGERMRHLYEATFGEAYQGPATHGEGARAARCMAVCMMHGKQAGAKAGAIMMPGGIKQAKAARTLNGIRVRQKPLAFGAGTAAMAYQALPR